MIKTYQNDKKHSKNNAVAADFGQYVYPIFLLLSGGIMIMATLIRF